ncbi:putative Histidine kinase [Candidatus Terasakiella magnetica]|nr:putative Histidine kinase [Candidatus Terasakiella magnetica]
MSQRTKWPESSWNFNMTIVMFVALVITLAFYIHAEKQIDRANERRHQSFRLADELRQSSDDLTRLVRSYVITGKSAYKNAYLDILAIRDGLKPRPTNYDRVYWDLVLVGDTSVGGEMGLAIPLLDLMKRSGFSPTELDTLAKAKTNSDGLTGPEFEAMRLVEIDGPGAEARRESAMAMLHDDAYYQAKAAIMRPINQFFLQMDQRTRDDVYHAEQTAMTLRFVVIGCIIGVIFFLWNTYRATRATLGGSADEVYAEITRIGQGDFSAAPLITTGAQNSVLARLSDMRTKLSAIETERKHSERILSESERRFREMAENIDQVFFIADDDYSHFHYISPAFARLWQRDPALLLAEPSCWQDWLHPEDRETIPGLIAARRGTGYYDAEFRIIVPDGSVRWLYAKAFEIERPDEGPRHVVGFHADVTVSKLAAEELREKNEALTRSNAELEAFAYVASHDLREPLRNITAFSTMLARRLEGRLQEDEREFITIITDAATRMDALVRDLLEFSRVGRGEYPAQPVALDHVVASALNSLRVQIETSGATVEVVSELPTVSGNEEELYRTLLNVIGNSLKYRREDLPPHIRIICTPKGITGWRIEIQDNGIGIEGGHGYEDRIFGLFQRLHQRNEYGGGTGIGLPICRKIINRHGGQIWAESEGLGKGTRFIITLPKAPPHQTSGG